jgi:hypothetical protein
LATHPVRLTLTTPSGETGLTCTRRAARRSSWATW